MKEDREIWLSSNRSINASARMGAFVGVKPREHASMPVTSSAERPDSRSDSIVIEPCRLESRTPSESTTNPTCAKRGTR